ncbi:NmrA family NAD(P)-binding protein [Pedobacter sp. KACC 23697]|uniref:NmrA family NAD(P)-binding protein n=1 Tax=Pedobacter sp. KACC 23697 TaxID=3149230 RepID=A0AAU7KAZ0_9SPHI
MNGIRPITVFGATGKIGTGLIALLSEAKLPVTAITRDLKKAIPLPFVQWKRADMSEPEALQPVLSKGGAVFLLSGTGPDCSTEQINVIRVAKEAGVSYIVKLSSGEADLNSPYFIPRTHGIVEEFLKKSKIPYTILRSNGMMQNWLGEIANSVKKQRIFYESTGDGKRAYVDRRDIIEAAYICLTKPEKHQNKTYFITGGKAVNYSELAQCISNVIQEKVSYVPISIEESRKEMECKVMPYALIETFCAYDAAQARGEKALVTDDLHRILNRQPRTIEQFVLDHQVFFKK